MAIPENIEQLANDIRTKIYGREVRESLAKGIEEAGSIANDANVRSQETETKQTSLEKKYDEQIANMSLENPSVAEVVDARVSGYNGQSYTTIGKRFDSVDAQLAENTKSIENVIVNAVSFGASNASNFDSTTAIQNAINFVSNLGGGEVRLPPGLWRTSSKLILKHNVALVGSGVNVTKIQIFSKTNDHVIELEPKTWKTGGTYQRVENLTIDGNKFGKTGEYCGIYAPSSVMYTYINNVEVQNCSGDGIKYVSSHRNILKNTVSHDNNGNGFVFTNEVNEGSGSVTDNHVEMGYLRSHDNSKNGFLFDQPIDTVAMHLIAGTNGLDGFKIKNPSGGWCNQFISLVAQGNSQHGVSVEGGGQIILNNVSVSVSGKNSIDIKDVDYSIFSNLTLDRPGENNIYCYASEGNSFNGLYCYGNSGYANIDFTLSTSNNLDNIILFGGLYNFHLRNSSNFNNINNVKTYQSVKHSVFFDNVKQNKMNNVDVRSAGLEGNIKSAISVVYSEGTVLTNIINTKRDTDPHVTYGIDISTSPNCIVSNCNLLGSTAGVRKHPDNTTSLISDIIIGGVVSTI